MTATIAGGAVPQAQSKLAGTSTRFDGLYTLLASFFVVGLYVDGWAHNHGRVDESFFTPWHAIFYSGFALVAVFLLGRMLINRRRGLSRRLSIPLGYEYSLIGVFVFGFGGVGDLVWHTLFGIEEDVEALLSPTHLLLVIGMVLIAAGPFRSASLRGDNGGGWRRLLPAVVSVLLVWSVISFITQFAHPFLQPWAAIDVGSQEIPAELFVMNADGFGQTRMTNTPDVFETHPSFSPDGRQVVYAAETEDGYEVFTMNLDGSGRQQLTHNQSIDWGPAWSPDGRWIAYSSEQDGPASIFVMPAMGGESRRLTSEGAEDWGATWSPDGSQIAFQRSAGGVQDVWRVNLDGSGLENLTGDDWNGFHPAWSPDGNAIAFVSNASGALHIYSLDLATREVEQVTFADGNQWNPAWSPDGSQMAYVSDTTGDDDIFVVSMTGGEPVNLTSMAAFSDGFPRWSPDGSQIVYRSRSISSGGWFTETSQAMGIATVILQSALLSGAVLLLVGRFRLPFGVFTLLFTLNALGMTLMDDEFRFIPAALLAGLLADFLVRQMQPGRQGPIYLFSFLVPLAYTGLYFATLFLTGEVVWTIHFWAGAIVLAGLTGFLAAYLSRLGQAPGLIRQS